MRKHLKFPIISVRLLLPLKPDLPVQIRSIEGVDFLGSMRFGRPTGL